jgi:hypothetical protein
MLTVNRAVQPFVWWFCIKLVAPATRFQMLTAQASDLDGVKILQLLLQVHLDGVKFL